jgi:anti-sigma factor ChrR (cupin superfamily)
VLFVKLRQYPGAERTHRVIQTTDLAWTPGARSGIEVKALYEQEGFTDTTRLERWAESQSFQRIDYCDGAEMLVIEGQFEDESGAYGPGSWLRFPVGSNHTPQTSQGCVVYIKEGGFAYLNVAA